MREFAIIDVEQGSPEWHLARCGDLTGSAAPSVYAERKRGTGELAERATLRLKIVSERLTGVPDVDTYKSPWMERGTEMQPVAIDAYERATGCFVQSSGYLKHTTLRAGCSLDGHIGDFEGIVEFKCPKSVTHVQYLRAGTVPEDYVAQVLHNLWISGAAWCDFVCFDDRFLDERLRLFRVRVERNEKEIAGYASKALAFLEEVEREVEALKTMANISAVLREAVPLNG